MRREEFFEKKKLEIQEEVDFLREEKAEAKMRSLVLEEEVRDKIQEIKRLAYKEQGIIDRIEHIDESESRVYGINTYWMSGTLINYSLNELQRLAISTFDTEEFGELPEKKENKTLTTVSKIDLQIEQNTLLLDMVNLLREMKEENKLKSTIISSDSLLKALSNK